MSDTIIISVTQKDIDSGIKGSHCDCPIALAIKRYLDANDNVFLGKKVSSVIVGGLWLFMPLVEQKDCERIAIDQPKEAREFITSFDLGLTVKPLDITYSKELHNVSGKVCIFCDF